MISVQTKSYKYRISKLIVGEDGKADCKAQKLFKDGWGNIENKRVRRLLAEIALKENKGVRSIGYKNDYGRVSRLSKKKKRAC